MPLENDIQGLTAAINRLADVFATSASQVGAARNTTAPTTKAEPEAEAETPKATKKAAPKPEPKAEAAKPAKSKPEPKAEEDDLGETDDVVDFDAVKTVLRELGAKMAEVKGATEGRQVVIDLLGEFKVAKAIELKTGQYAAFVKRATELMTAGDAGGVEVEDEDDLVG